MSYGLIINTPAGQINMSDRLTSLYSITSGTLASSQTIDFSAPGVHTSSSMSFAYLSNSEWPVRITLVTDAIRVQNLVTLSIGYTLYIFRF